MTTEAWTIAPVYTVSGIGPYGIPHPYAEGAIQAFVTVAGAQVLLTGTDYTLTPTAADATGNLFLSPAAAATHAGRPLTIDRRTPDEQGWVGIQGDREKGLEVQLDRLTQSIQEVRRDAGGALRIRGNLPALDWATGTVPIRTADGVASGPTVIQIANAAADAALAESARIAAGIHATNAGNSAAASEASAGAAAAAGTPIPVAADRAALKAINTASRQVAFLAELGREGIYEWQASIPADRARADAQEQTFVSPNLANPGAWVRVVLSPEEKRAINRALNERPFEAPPEAIEAFNALIPPAPANGRQVNFNSTSENLADAHYIFDAGVSRVVGDTMTWQGIVLQRLTGIGSFASAVRDARLADYPLVPGRRYIVSAVVWAPFIEADNFNVRGPWNRFSWMWGPANAASHGHGAKLIGPTPRRVWQMIEAETATAVRVVGNPAVGLSASPSGNIQWYRHCSGLGAALAGRDIYIGGLQIEEAPNQTEKVGIALIGTSIDTSTSSLQHWTQDRSWPRYLEGLLSVPIFNGAMGGQSSTQLEARFDTDVAPWGVNAKYCILAANVNDFQSGFNSATYRANWLSMYNKAIAAGMIPIFMTPPRASTYNYANGAADKEAEIAHIKATYPFVIDRDEVYQDAFNANLLNDEYESDGLHPNLGVRQLAFMIYTKYRHFFSFDNVPGPYQRTINANDRIQSFGGPLWAGRFAASRITSTSATGIRDTQEATAPILIFEAALGAPVTYQLPCANYQRAAERVNTDVQVQIIRNVTGQTISIQYYQRDIANTLSTVGGVLGPIPNGETWTLATDGVAAWRVI